MFSKNGKLQILVRPEIKGSIRRKFITDLAQKPEENMEIHHNSFSAKIFLCSIIILVCSSCGINISYLKNDKNPPPEKKAFIESDSTPSHKLLN